jgi:hypothetical protein
MFGQCFMQDHWMDLLLDDDPTGIEMCRSPLCFNVVQPCRQGDCAFVAVLVLSSLYVSPTHGDCASRGPYLRPRIACLLAGLVGK